MRLAPLSMLLFALGATPCAAQAGRFSFELTAGRGMDTPIFRHQVTDPVGGTTVTRLAVDDASVAGARVGYRLPGSWTLVGDIGYGSSGYAYSEFSMSAGGLLSSIEQWGPASRFTAGVALTHRTVLAALPLTVEPEVGLAMRRLSLGTPGPECVPQPPSTGALFVCIPRARWVRAYSVPSVGAGLGLSYAVVPRVAVEVRGQYAVGRTSTREAFYEDLLPAYDYAEAPTSQTIRSAQLALGLRITP